MCRISIVQSVCHISMYPHTHAHVHTHLHTHSHPHPRTPAPLIYLLTCVSHVNQTLSREQAAALLLQQDRDVATGCCTLVATRVKCRSIKVTCLSINVSHIYLSMCHISIRLFLENRLLHSCCNHEHHNKITTTEHSFCNLLENNRLSREIFKTPLACVTESDAYAPHSYVPHSYVPHS